ncbi:MAG: AhpC/TSA family protein [Bacteroidaceae bacterium]|jgi:peroxiredoxin|nr:AhpC/TSA family protein [Bacteroidaceae bacterium]MBQ5617413.1 AhpC/TSA family protein [Bacteroidaceae bacterium]
MRTKEILKSIFLCIVLTLSVQSYAKVDLTTIKGTVQGIKEGRLYMLARTGEKRTDTLGCCDFKKGKFDLRVNLQEPMITQLVVEGYSGGFTLIAEPATAYKAKLSNDSDFYIKGGNLNESYTAHMASSDSMRAIVTALQERYKTMREEKKFRSASQINDTLRIEQSKLQELTATFLKNNDNVILAYTMLSNIEMREMGLRETKELYRSMGEGAKATHCGAIIKERIDRMEKTAGGAVAPDFTLPDLNGNPVTMSEVKGKIKIIDFWASWCGPCRMNNPALRKIYQEFHSKGLEIIGVSLDNSKVGWQKAIEKDGLEWINVSSLKGWDCEVVRLYNVTGVPSLFILNEYNRIIATGLRDEQLRTFLEENLQ